MSRRHTAVVFVGRRNGARRAARAQGLTFEVLDPNAPLPLPDDLLGRLQPSAVVAVTEAAVLPAARLRAALALPGNSVATAERCTDKLAMKRAIHAAGLPCARFSAVDGSIDGEALVERLGLPLMLKARVGSGGRGARQIRSKDQLPRHVNRPHIGESFVRGIEMSVESFVVDGAPVFVNATEYVEPQWANLVPANLDGPTVDALTDLNRRAIEALGIERGMTHMEVFLTDDGPFFGELAVRPPGGHIMRLIELAYDFDAWEMLLQVECGLAPDFNPSPRRVAGVRFIHPGRGVVRAVRGFDAVESTQGLNEFHCTLSRGATIAPRDGTGQHHGYAVFTGDQAQVRRGIEAVRDRLIVDMEQSRR